MIKTKFLEKIIEIMKGTEDGQVLQRFGLAILTKMSLNENTAQIFIKYGVVDFIIKLLQRSRINKINQFCLDFSTALLANILRTKDIKEFKKTADVIIANRFNSELNDVKQKIYTRDLYFRD